MKMNTPNEPQRTKVTLEMISQQKVQKLTEIRESKQRITDTAIQLFRPNEVQGGSNALMNNFSSGIAIFNGVMTGFKIIKRIRSLFKRK
ncbi:MAG: hypothetical protein J6C58_01415 [Bacteroidaceae bacterium]|nr:hypothetical protein [Bacteroidaceae bacterium]